MNKLKNPPKIARLFLRFFLDRIDHYSYFGDVEEMYNEIYETTGKISAITWLWIQVFKSIPIYLKISIVWSYEMFKNYLKIAFRNLKKNKSFSIINIFGFSIGITACITIFLYAQYFLSYDKFHQNLDTINLIQRETVSAGIIRRANITPLPLLNKVKEDIPEILTGTRIYNTYPIITYGEYKFYQELSYVDEDFFDIFSFEIINGNKENALNDRNEIYITEEIANKYFGDEDPLGKTMIVNSEHSYVVGGVIKNFPGNSSITFDIITNIENAYKLPNIKRWDTFYSSFLITYVVYDKDRLQNEIELKLNKLLKSVKPDTPADKEKYKILPFSELHEFQSNDSVYTVAIMAVAGTILLIAIMNFVNLSTARTFYRTKEIGMRKVLGAKRLQLVKQFMLESFLITGFSALLGITMVKIILPGFNEYIGLPVEFSISTNLYSLISLLVFVIALGILSGIIPALFFSNCRSVESLKGINNFSSSGLFFRNILVIGQFTFSIILIISSIMMWRQLSFLQNSDIGFDKENLVSIRLPSNKFKNPARHPLKNFYL